MRDERAKSRGEPLNLAGVAQDVGETRANGGRDWLLCSGVKSLLRCDEAEVVNGIAHYVISQHGSLRHGAAWVERKRETSVPAMTALLGGLVRFLEVRAGDHRDGAVWIARLINERQAIETLPLLLPELGWSELKFRWRPDAASFLALARNLGSNWRRVLRLTRRLHRQYHFFKVLRVADLIGYYSRYLGIFQRRALPPRGDVEPQQPARYSVQPGGPKVWHPRRAHHARHASKARRAARLRSGGCALRGRTADLP